MADADDPLSTQKLFVLSAVSIIFRDDDFGSFVYNILTNNHYEQSTEILDDLKDPKDSFIIDSVHRDKHKLLHQVLLRIFQDGILDIDTLKQSLSLPSTLSECTQDHIQIIARIVSNHMNQTHKTAKTQINVENVSTLIAAENIDGSSISSMSSLQFQKMGKRTNIPPPKTKKIWNGIRTYYDRRDQSFFEVQYIQVHSACTHNYAVYIMQCIVHRTRRMSAMIPHQLYPGTE